MRTHVWGMCGGKEVCDGRVCAFTARGNVSKRFHVDASQKRFHVDASKNVSTWAHRGRTRKRFPFPRGRIVPRGNVLSVPNGFWLADVETFSHVETFCKMRGRGNVFANPKRSHVGTFPRSYRCQRDYT